MAGSASLLWVIAGLIGLITVAPRTNHSIEPELNAQTAASFTIDRAPDGQFYTDANVGDVPIRLMLDPGADVVLLAGRDAERLGLAVTMGHRQVTLPGLAVGPYHLTDVAPVVAPDLPVSLLGQSFLSRLSRIEIGRNKVTLR